MHEDNPRSVSKRIAGGLVRLGGLVVSCERHGMLKRIRGLSIAVSLVALATTRLYAAEPATPQRPSFSADPNTTADGTLEVEAGYLAGDGEAADLGLTMKWGSGPFTELFLGWSPWVRSNEGQDGAGNVSLGVRHRFHEQAARNFAMAYQITGTIPTASAEKGLGTGVPDIKAAFTTTATFDPIAFVAYYQTGFLGRSAGRDVLVEHALAVAAAAPLGARMSGFVEWTGFWRPELDSTDHQALGGLGLTVQDWLVVDGAVGIAMADEDEFFGTIGCTANLGRPFRLPR